MACDIEIWLLKQLLDYDPQTGKLVWLERPAALFADAPGRPAEHTCKWWNARFAGREALGYCGKRGRLSGKILGRSYYAHRVAWALYYGEWPQDEVSHEDGVERNNCIGNLRLAPHQVNMRNKRLYRTNRSGSHGVVFQSRGQRWQAYITVNRKRRHLGYFVDREAAIQARRAAEQESGVFHKNHGRAA